MDNQILFPGIDGDCTKVVDSPTAANSIILRCQTPMQLETFFKLNKKIIEGNTLCSNYYKARRYMLNNNRKINTNL